MYLTETDWLTDVERMTNSDTQAGQEGRLAIEVEG